MQPAPPPAKKNQKIVTLIIAGIALAVVSVSCVGCMAAIAIPAFTRYIRAAKTAEASQRLSELYVASATYYAEEHAAPDGTVLTGCTVSSAITSNTPSGTKSALGPLPPSFEALGVTFVDPVYFQYEIVSAGGCGHPPGTPLYTFRAHGDLDGDGTRSLFELTAESGSAPGELVRRPGIARQNETE
jgi:type II secretory pathway pseudopilin PulG